MNDFKLFFSPEKKKKKKINNFRCIFNSQISNLFLLKVEIFFSSIKHNGLNKNFTVKIIIKVGIWIKYNVI